jgi:hypothetical protein
MKAKIILFLSAVLLVLGSISGQNKSVGIGTLIPDNSAVLDLESTNQGFLMTQLDSSQIVSIITPKKGLIVFNKVDQCFWYKRLDAWKRICPTDSLYNKFIQTNMIKTDSLYLAGKPIQNVITQLIDSTAWLLKGNNGIDANKHFIGTINPADWVIKTSNKERMRVRSNGFIGIGISNPATLFSVGRGGSNFRVDSNGVTYLKNGSKALPQLTFIADKTTGIYSPGTAQLGISANGIEGFYLNGTSRSIHLGLIGSSNGMGFGLDNFQIGNGSSKGSGNFNMGYNTRGQGNVCISHYDFNNDSVVGDNNFVIGESNKVSVPPGIGGAAYIFGINNFHSATTGTIGNFMFGISNTYTGPGGTNYIIGYANAFSGTANGSAALGGYINISHQGVVGLSDFDAYLPRLTSTADNQMIARFIQGYVFYTNSISTSGVAVAAGGGSWASLSDKMQKENFAPVDKEELLKKFCNVPAVEWQYISQRPDRKFNQYQSQPKHIGIMAQDFKASFGYGEFNDRITQTDIDGVMTVAIQALEERTKKINEIEKQLLELNERLSKFLTGQQTK